MAVGFAYIPSVWSLSLWGLVGLAEGGLVMTRSVWGDPDGTAAVLLIFAIIHTQIWQLVILIKMIAEINAFSQWRAMGAFLLPAFVIAAVILAIPIAIEFLFDDVYRMPD